MKKKNILVIIVAVLFLFAAFLYLNDHRTAKLDGNKTAVEQGTTISVKSEIRLSNFYQIRKHHHPA